MIRARHLLPRIAMTALGAALMLSPGPEATAAPSTRLEHQQGSRNTSPKPAWKDIDTWAVQYQGFTRNDLSNIIDAPGLDLVVLGRLDGWGREWEADNIARVKKNRWVLAYIAGGQAQTHEWYWKPDFKPGNPSWLLNLPMYNGTTYSVRYWDPEWIKIKLSTIDLLIERNFDGMFIDQADPYWNEGFPGGASTENQQRSINLVCRMTIHARLKKPGFKIIVNGTAELIDRGGYSACWDGIAAEHLWFVDNGKLDRASYREYILEQLPKAISRGKKVFTFDFTQVPDEIERVRREARSRGLIPYFTDPAVKLPPIPRNYR